MDAAPAEIPNPIEMSRDTIRDRFVQDIDNNYLNVRVPPLDDAQIAQLTKFRNEIRDTEEANTQKLMKHIKNIYNHIRITMKIDARGHLKDADIPFGKVKKAGIRIINDKTQQEIRVLSYDEDFKLSRFHYPNGRVEERDIVMKQDTLFNTAMRKLEEETGITKEMISAYRDRVSTEDRLDRDGTITRIYIFIVEDFRYKELVAHMNTHKNEVHGRSADVRLIYYKKYMKYKAKYLQLVAQLRK